LASNGRRDAPAARVSIHGYRDLLCWQLAHELKCEVLAFTDKAPVARDFKFCDQIRDSAAAAPRDIAEGFGRGRPREYARFLEFALGSLTETQASLIDGIDRGHLAAPLGPRLVNLAAAAIRVTSRLLWAQRRQAEGRPRPQTRERRSFTITLAELEARARARRTPEGD
jgi:four helix bundle protein